MLLPAAASIAAGMSIAGTQNTTSEVSLATNGFNSSINAFCLARSFVHFPVSCYDCFTHKTNILLS